MTDRIVIVGASLAGSRTVRLLRRYGFEGEIVLVGDEPHLPYDRPPLSKQLLAGSLEADDIALEGAVFYEGVDVRLGAQAVGLEVSSGTVHLADRTSVSGDHVVIATGAAPRRLPDQPDLPGVHVLRTLDDALALRADVAVGRRVVVVGAGFIGMEVAATCRGLGAEVTVVELSDVPLVRGLGRQLGAAVGRIHEARGIRLLTNAAVSSFEGVDRVRGVTLTDGGQLRADVVVVGIGVAPATGWLEGSGLTLDDGVVCDDHLRAVGGEGRVWAVGDVSRWPSARFGESLRVEHWTNATETAQVVARNLTGGGVVHDPVPYVWSDQFGLKLQVVGRVTPEDDVELVLGSFEDQRWVATAMRDGELRGAVGLASPRATIRLQQLVRSRAGPSDVAALLDTSRA